MGRPSNFSQKIADIICDRIALGESLRSICEDDGLPHERTVHRWLSSASDEKDDWASRFRQQYAHAREAQADTDADAIGDIGRKTLKGEYDPQAARVAIDALKWSAGKRAPKKYGDKFQLGGDEAGSAIRLAVSWLSEG